MKLIDFEIALAERRLELSKDQLRRAREAHIDALDKSYAVSVAEVHVLSAELRLAPSVPQERN